MIKGSCHSMKRDENPNHHFTVPLTYYDTTVTNIVLNLDVAKRVLNRGSILPARPAAVKSKHSL